MSVEQIKKQFKSLFNEVSRLVEDKFFFEQYQEYVRNSLTLDKSNEFLYFISLNYIESATLGIYRQVDGNWKSQSLLKVLREIKANYQLFTYKRFSRKYTGFMKHAAQADFQKFAVKSGKIIDRRKINKDIAELIKITKPIVKYRHKVVAHRNKRKVTINGRVNDLFAAINFIEQLTIKYTLLLNQSGMTTLLAGNAHPQLEKIFK